jgi:hypothetical protein
VRTWTVFDFLGLPLLKGGTQVAGGNDIPPLPHSISTSYTRHWLFLILRLFTLLCQLAYLRNQLSGLPEFHIDRLQNFLKSLSISVS